jgi:NADPH2:quinone reductase
MKGSGIQSYIYRYFFTPPQAAETELLQEITNVSGSMEFKVLVGALYPLEDWKIAIDETVHRPERGKRFFRMPDCPLK